MAGYFEEPAVDRIQPEPFDAEDWLIPKNVRDIIHVGRDLLLNEVRLKLQILQPTLAAQGGFAFYRTYANDAEYQILVNNQTEIAGEHSTVIVTNKISSPEPGDPHFPDGRTMHLTDLVIPDKSRWANFAWESFYKHQMTHAWPAPIFATLLEPKANSVRLVGNLKDPDDFRPQPALDRQEVSDVSDVLWDTLGALALCSPVSLDENVTDFRD